MHQKPHQPRTPITNSEKLFQIHAAVDERVQIGNRCASYCVSRESNHTTDLNRLLTRCYADVQIVLQIQPSSPFGLEPACWIARDIEIEKRSRFGAVFRTKSTTVQNFASQYPRRASRIQPRDEAEKTAPNGSIFCRQLSAINALFTIDIRIFKVSPTARNF